MPPSRRRPPQEFIADITVPDDGVRPVRTAHDWTRDKLGILASYLRSYTKACQSAPNVSFVDAMAGPGLCQIEETGEFLLGSTPIALTTHPPFTKVLALEFSAANASALKQRTEQFGGRVEAVRADCNRDLLSLMNQHIPRRGPVFVLLDPEGAELEWSTIREVSGFRNGPLKAEVLILFATEGVNRMLPVEAEIELHNEMRLNQLFPPESEWRTTWERRRLGEISAAEARSLYVEGYMAGLSALGFRFVLPREIRRTSGALVYHLIFASDHPAGERIMEDVFGTMNTNDPQMRLL